MSASQAAEGLAVIPHCYNDDTAVPDAATRRPFSHSVRGRNAHHNLARLHLLPFFLEETDLRLSQPKIPPKSHFPVHSSEVLTKVFVILASKNDVI